MVGWLVGWFYGVKHYFQQYFCYIMAVSFIGGGNQSRAQYQDKTTDPCKSLTNFIT